jgi:hypothetical protein
MVPIQALRPDPEVPSGRWCADWSEWARHHSRPEERPASHHAFGDH